MVSSLADVAVVGAGPAGVAAAVRACEAGADVVLVDAGPGLGGQYYRRPSPDLRLRVGDPRPHVWTAFDGLEARLARHVLAGRVRVVQDATVWAVQGGRPFVVRTRGADRPLGSSPGDQTGEVVARTVVIATGAFDRHLPFPGWDLPGVLSGGAAQALVKGHATRPGRVVVVAGTGPFLLAVAATLLEARVRVVAVVEAGAPERLARHVPGLLAGAGKCGELTRYVTLLARRRVPYLRRHRVIQVHGDDAVEAVTVARVDAGWRSLPDTRRRLACDTVAVGFGFTAQTDLLLQLGCATRIGDDEGLAVVVDADQRTDVDGVFAAGETTGIGGAELALLEGLVAGAAAARAAGAAGPLAAAHSGELRRARRRIGRLRRFATALNRAFAVQPGWQDDLTDDTVVCRCEEVDAGAVREAIGTLGATDARTVKLLTRAGMGWCQGRICGFAVDRMCPGRGPRDGGRLADASKRPLVVPVSLGAVAALGADPAGPG